MKLLLQTFMGLSEVFICVSDKVSSKDIQYLACSVYRHALQTVPAIVRQWWKEQDRKTLNYIDR